MNPPYEDIFDVIVIGGGHAGCEAFAAAARVGVKAALVSPSARSLAYQPCNPAVGGPGKGHLVREVVALGGLMGRVTDGSGLQFRTLNRRKGPAVRSTRVQTDSARYVRLMAQEIGRVPPPSRLVEGVVAAIGIGNASGRRRVVGVTLDSGLQLSCEAVVVTTGTYLRGMLFVGEEMEPGGRRGAAPSTELARSLEDLGLPMMRLKTGTCPRLDGSTIDPENLEEQPGEVPPPFFDPGTWVTSMPQLCCHLTYTNELTHRIIGENMGASAMYGGAITGIGPRYCPSIEAKIDLFPNRERHQIFLEPEDAAGAVIYPSGLSTSLPRGVQEEMVRSIRGLERARIVRYGYAVEYDAFQPQCLSPTLEVDGIDGLYLAGQIIGTSGYEEAAALGLVAGANAALATRGEGPLSLSRDSSYAGVMIDDLTGKGVDEPYRMFTSRAEYRLLLREDNADERLLDQALAAGLIDRRRGDAVREKISLAGRVASRLREEILTPTAEANRALEEAGIGKIKKPASLEDLLRRDGVDGVALRPLAPWLEKLDSAVIARVETDVKYAGYLDRQEARARKLGEMDRISIPRDIEYRGLPGLRNEIVQKLERSRPANLGQASRIPGMTPAAIDIVRVFLERRGKG